MFIVRPEIDILNEVKELAEAMIGKQIHILFIPRRTYECDNFIFEPLNNMKIDKENVAHINMELIPLENDMLSMELPNNFARHMLEDDDTYKIYVQYSIHKLEAVYGKIK